MKAGKRNFRVTLLRPVETNSDGSLKISYSPVTTVFANVISVTGRIGQETVESAKPNAREQIRVGLPYRTDVDNSWRLEWKGQTYNVKYTDRTAEQDGDLWLTAEAVGAL
jgi:SPP1 family predicted phage head-tail adaptor